VEDRQEVDKRWSYCQRQRVFPFVLQKCAAWQPHVIRELSACYYMLDPTAKFWSGSFKKTQVVQHNIIKYDDRGGDSNGTTIT
jgi:hypothetical protein